MKEGQNKSPSEPKLVDEILSTLGTEDGAQLLGSDGLAIKIRGVIPTQCPSVDLAIGRGGIPLGRLTIAHGAEGSGKTTLALHIVASCQQQGGVAIYMDKEYKLDPDYARNIGVDTSRLIIVQPPYLEKVFSKCGSIIKKAAENRAQTGERTPILVVLDSMNAAITKSEFEGSYEDNTIAAQARVWSRSLPKLIPQVNKEDIALLFISQVRQKIDVMYGKKDDIAGGNAPRFYASLIMDVKGLSATKEDGEKVSNKIRVECIKNQIAPPFKKAECEIVYGRGIDKELSLLVAAEKLGLAKLTGTWWAYRNRKFGPGHKKAAEMLRGKHKKSAERMLEDIRSKAGWS